MYNRDITNKIKSKLGGGKAIIIIGPRQVGKTTLINNLLSNKDYLFINGDDTSDREMLKNANTSQLKSIIGNHKIVFIDEAQRIENIGLSMKIIVDQIKDVQLIASGSSAIYISNKLNEPLTGRKWEYILLPISWNEFEDKHGYLESEKQLENRLLYGFYPDILNNVGSEKVLLKQLLDSYLYRDILSFSNIKKPEILENLLKALALQVGSELNYSELSRLIGVDKNTVSKYIDILCKNYVVFKLSSFSRNLRSEIKHNNKIYFYDNGVRNAIIGNFNPLSLRNDKGALWENFLISERVKHILYNELFTNYYFWRTKQQQEVDFVEQNSGKIIGYKFKWKASANAKLPKTFVNAYNAEAHIIDRTNFRDFVMPSISE